MRVALMAGALIALASGCAESQAVEPLVVLVHGRGHMDDDTTALRRAWKRDLDTALARAGAPALREENVRLAWYGDVLDPSAAAGCPSLGSRREGDEASFARDFLGSLAASLPREDARDARMLLGDMLYAMDESRRCGARARVAALLDTAAAQGRPVVLVTYSLGSVVSYAALRTRARDARTGITGATGAPVHLITLGSPLGIPMLRAWLGETASLVQPRGVASWANVYDAADAFAAPLAGDVSSVIDLPVRTAGHGNPHEVSRYLRDEATGEALARALCLSGDRAPAACRSPQERRAKTRSSS